MNFKTEKELQLMKKKEIDAYGASIGIKLDGRKKKDTLIRQVLEFQEEEIKREREALAATLVEEPVADKIDELVDNVGDKWGQWIIVGGVVFLVVLAFVVTYILN